MQIPALQHRLVPPTHLAACAPALRRRLIQLEMGDLGLQVAYHQVPVAELGDDIWRGVANKYWHLPTYFLPVVTRRALPAVAFGAGLRRQGQQAPTASGEAA